MGHPRNRKFASLSEEGKLAEATARFGLIYGQMGGRAEAELLNVPHDIDVLQFRSLKLSDELRQAARLFLPTNASNLDSPIEVYPHSPTVRLGSRQKRLLELLEEIGFSTEVLSGYRSTFFQTLLYASRFLDGTLFDLNGRVSVAVPGQSDHEQIDKALDVANPILFSLAALQFRHFVQIKQPYLFSQSVASEPWHFSTEFLEGCSANDHTLVNDSFVQSVLANLASFFSTAADTNPHHEYIFVSGRSLSGAYKCIGSKQGTFADSFSDALSAVGNGWAYYVISVLRGFTPIMDNRVLDQDVGRLAFRITGDDNRQGYLLPSSCSFERILNPSAVQTAITKKIELGDEEDFFLEKSQVVDLLYIPDKALQLARPRIHARSTAPIDLAKDIGSAAFNWLRTNWRDPFPAYHHNAYFGPLPEPGDLTRYAFTLDTLSEASARTDDLRDFDITSIVENGLKRIARIERDPVTQAGISRTDETAVHVAKAACRLPFSAELSEYWISREPVALERALRFLAGQGPSVDVISTGHLMELLVQKKSTEHLATLRGFWKLKGARLCLRAIQSDLSFSLGAAQVFCAMNDEEAASELVSHILKQPPCAADECFGAFAGYADFRSLLITEALVRISLQFASIKSMPVLFQLIRDGLLFARQLQLGVEANIVCQRLGSNEGAITHSLFDHNFYIDYVAHALRLAAAVRRLFSEHD